MVIRVSLSARLFCLDTVMIDVILKIPSIPTAGSDTLAPHRLVTTGGGYNAMSAATRQGMACVYAGRLGTGPFSSIAREALLGDSIATPIEPDASSDVGFCVALIDDVGERTFITSPGSEVTLRPLDLAGLDVSDGDYVLVSGYNVIYSGLDLVVLDWLANLPDGVVVAFDPSNRVMDIPAQNLDMVFTRADWVFCNETEASLLTGEGVREESARALAARSGRRGVVVRQGASGCSVTGVGEATQTVPGFTTEVLDTNGAGDTHTGVFLAELARGTAVLDAAQRANAAASVAISLLGPASCPTRDVVTAMVEA